MKRKKLLTTRDLFEVVVVVVVVVLVLIDVCVSCQVLFGKIT